jgi:co-chaperonin GroES (HSP10)
MSFNAKTMGKTSGEWTTEEEIPDPDVLPEIKGYHVLIRPVAIKQETAGSIILPEQVRDDLHYLHTVGRVVKLGNEAYDNKQEPWCKVGDFVVYQRFAGSKLLYRGIKFLVINDDEVVMTVVDPEDIDPHFNLTKYK